MREFAEHRGYLADEKRVAAYRAALSEVVQPGMVVLDLGAGTGVLGLLALEAGADRVHAVDSGPIIEVARQIATANGASVTYHRGGSDRVELPEPVDLVVCDQHDPTGVRAGLLPSFHDAGIRHLAPGGIAVPSEIEVCIAAVTSAEALASVAFWRSRPAGLDVSPVADLASNDILWTNVGIDDLVGSPVISSRIDTLRHGPGPVAVGGEVTATHDATVHGVAVWFRSHLSPGVILTNEPGHPAAIDRDQAILPLAVPVEVKAGDVLEVRASVGQEVHWRVARAESTERAPWQSTMAGHCIGPDDLQRRDVEFQPGVSGRGRVVALVAALMAEGATIGQLREAVGTRLPDEVGRQPADELVDWAVALLAP